MQVYTFVGMKAKEAKKRFILMLKPSTKKKAAKKALKQKKSLSEIAENLLYDWSAE